MEPSYLVTLADARTFVGNCAFRILRPKAHSPTPTLGGLGLRTRLLFA
jgi:hypothetical protein